MPPSSSPAPDSGRSLEGEDTLRRTGRVANLDLLRALAILLVVACNAVGEQVLDLGAMGNHVMESGWVGVDLFFVLSGWLVGGLYWRERQRFGDVRIGRFWARRWLRTVPAYLVAFAAITVIRGVLIAPEPFEPRYLVFAQNYLERIPYWGVSWSLCVEEHFYLALPLVLGLAVRARWGVPLAMGAAVLLSLGLRLATIEPGTAAWGLGYTQTHLRMEGLALGVAAAWVYHVRPEFWPAVQRAARVLVVPGLMFVASVPWLSLDILTRFAYTGVDLAFAALVIVMVDARPSRLASSRAVAWIALTSYSVYMTHMAAFDAWRRIMHDVLPAPLVALGALAAAAAVGLAFFHAVERPSLWLRQRIAPHRPRPAPSGDGHPDPGLLVELAVLPLEPAERTERADDQRVRRVQQQVDRVDTE